ncbi:MAG: DUF445 family protein [Candidatus Bipolaricaulia bacterium]
MKFEFYLLGLPLIASVIGYLTNWIAIRMLFRPLEEKKLLGHRIPFTPGLIPKRKSDIAENIGRAVGEHLLTPNALEARLGSPEVKEELEKALERWIESSLNKERSSLVEMVPEKTGSELETLTEGLISELQEGLDKLVAGEDLESIIKSLIEVGVENLSEKELGEVMPRWSHEKLILKLDQILSKLADSDRLEHDIKGFWERKLTELKDSGGSVGDYLGEELTELIVRQVETYLPTLLKRGAELLDRPELRARLEELVVDLLDEKIQGEFEDESVWDQVKLGFLETLVLPREKLRNKVAEMIEDGVPKLIDLLEQEELREEMTSSAVESLRKTLRKDLSKVNWSDKSTENLAEGLTDISVTLVKNDRVQSVVLESFVAVLKDSEDRKVGDLLEFGRENEKEALVRALTGYVVESLQSESVQSKFVSVVEEKVRDLREREIGKLSRWIDPDLLTPFAGPLVDKLTGVVARQGSNILNALDVKELVKGEVEDFSTERVEKLILDVTGDQFRAITWFGALIGFLIGLLQILIITFGG